MRAREPVGPADDRAHAAARDVDVLVEPARAQVLAREQVARVEHRAGRDARALQLGGRLGGAAVACPGRDDRHGVRARGDAHRALERLGRREAHREPAVLARGRDEPAREGAEILVAAPRQLLAVRLEVQHGLGHDDDAELVHPEIDVLPRVRPLAVHERCEQRDEPAPAGDEVGVGLADLRGPALAVAGEMRDPHRRLQARALRPEGGPRSRRSVARVRERDEARIAGPQVVGGHAPAAQHPRREVVEQDVGLAEQVEEHLAALRLRQVERQRPLAAVDDVERPRAVPPVPGRGVVEERVAEQRARLVEAVRRLDLDDLGPEVGEERAHVGHGEHGREVDDAQPRQGRPAALSRAPRRPVRRSAAERRRSPADSLRRGRQRRDLRGEAHAGQVVERVPGLARLQLRARQEVGRRLHAAAEVSLARGAQEEVAARLRREVLGQDRLQLGRVVRARLGAREARIVEAGVAEEVGQALRRDEPARLQRHEPVGGRQRLAGQRIPTRRPAALHGAHERVVRLVEHELGGDALLQREIDVHPTAAEVCGERRVRGVQPAAPQRLLQAVLERLAVRRAADLHDPAGRLEDEVGRGPLRSTGPWRRTRRRSSP